MTDPDLIARAIVKKARADLRATAEQLRFEFRERAVCVTCGAELQTGRCPWTKPGAAPAVDGRIYCGWPRVSRASPSYRFPNRRT